MASFYSMSSVTHVFNQYYWDLLKKSKDLAKDLKHKAESDNARKVLKEIKNSYMQFDKSSDEHLLWYREHVSDVWKTFAAEKSDVTAWKNWSDSEQMSVELYKGITIQMLASLYKSKDVLLYYLVLLSVFASSSVTTEHITPIIELLRKKTPITEEDVSFIEDVGVRTSLTLLSQISATPASNEKTGGGTDRLLSELENTSLGKLAKEIMQDIDVENIHNSIGEGGDILKAFSDPNGELSKLVGNVTQKMISKLASGELKQDTLLTDAMKLAGSLPGGAAGGMGGMFEQFSKMAGMFGKGGDDDGDFDIASMMKNMMGGAGKSGGTKGTRPVVNSAALTRNVKAKQLRKKLEERRKVKENIETQVGDNQ